MPEPGSIDRMLDIGHVGRPHGLRGEVLVTLTTDRHERVAPGTVLSSDRGDLVVAASRPHQERWIVSFSGHTTREAADELRGLTLRAHALDDPDELWVHDMIGATVVTRDGTEVGRCVAVVANPAADLIELDSGALVPVVFVVDHDPGRIVVEPPEGLFEL